MMKGQLDLAMLEYRVSGKLDSTFALPYMNMANIQMQIKNIPAAIENYKKALQIKPDMFVVHLSLGMIYYQFKNEIPTALDYLKEALRLSPTQPDTARIKSLIVELENKQPTWVLFKGKFWLYRLIKYSNGDGKKFKREQKVGRRLNYYSAEY